MIGKNIRKKAVVSMLALTIAATAGTVSASAEEQISETHFENDSIIINVFDYESIDLFSILNTKQEKLLYQGPVNFGFQYVPDTATSRCYVEVDGNCTDLKAHSYSVDKDAKSLNASFENNGVTFTRTLSVTNNSTTGKDDAVEIKVTAANTDSVEHNVGVRIMLDTMLGSNDDAPFRVSGYGAVSTNTQYEGADIPLTYSAFDDLSNPTVVASGAFLANAEKPDIVQFNNFKSATDHTLIPNVNTSTSIGDSTVNAIWKVRTMQPGESAVFRTFYSTSALDISNESALVLAAQKSTGSFTVNEEGTGYNTVSIESYLKNTGNVDLNNVSVSLTLPNGVSVEDGESSHDYGKMPVGDDELQKTWVLKAEPAGNERNVAVVVNAKSDETGMVTPVTLTFTIPAIEGAPIIEDTTAPETTVEESTAAPSDAQSSTSSDKKSTNDQATTSAKSSSSSSSSSSSAIQTGAAIPAIMVLLVILSAIGVLYFYRRKTND